MLIKTSGIVFKTVKYSENSVIAKIYTRNFGLRSYIIRTGGKKSRFKKSFLQPLTLLELVAYNKANRDVQHVKEIENPETFKNIPFDIRKTSMLLFINELIYKAVREEEANDKLYGFIRDSLLELDSAEEDTGNFHLWFTLQLTKYLGFYPRNNFSEANKLFDLQEGQFISDVPLHENHLNAEMSRAMGRLIAAATPPEIPARNAATRNRLLDALMDYYSLHLPNFGGIKSHEVLKKVLN